MVKNNQPTLAAAIESLFEAAERVGFQSITHTEAEWIEKDHGRLQRRRCVVIEDLSPIHSALAGWSGAKIVIRMECERTCGGVTSHERRYYLCSRLATAAYLGEVVRGHWGGGKPTLLVIGRGVWRGPGADAHGQCRRKLLGPAAHRPKSVSPGQNQQGWRQDPTPARRQR